MQDSTQILKEHFEISYQVNIGIAFSSKNMFYMTGEEPTWISPFKATLKSQIPLPCGINKALMVLYVCSNLDGIC